MGKQVRTHETPDFRVRPLNWNSNVQNMVCTAVDWFLSMNKSRTRTVQEVKRFKKMHKK